MKYNLSHPPGRPFTKKQRKASRFVNLNRRRGRFFTSSINGMSIGTQADMMLAAMAAATMSQRKG